jgi:mannose-1-phosphate guanylyltransferase
LLQASSSQKAIPLRLSLIITKSFYYKQIEYKLAVQEGEKLKAMILAGGFATRLRPLSCTRPKMLFPIVNKPLLQWTFERLAKNNVSEAILATSYRTEILFKQYRIPRCGIHITYSRDPLRKPLGTGGPIRKAEKLIGHREPFLVLNGDIFAETDYQAILKEHEKNGATATIALHEVEDPSRYGVAELARDAHIKTFVEKPPPGTAPSNLINAGVYVLSPKIFQYIPKKRGVSLEREVFPKLVAEGKLYGHVLSGLWMDIGKPEDYLKINRKMLDLVADQQRYKVSSEVEVRKPVAIDRDVSIGKGSKIGPHAILGRDVIAGKDVHIKDSVAFPGAVICDSASVDNAIIGEGAAIGRNVKIGKNCVIGDHAKIGDNVSLAEGVLICPANEVSKSVLTACRNC